jgi:hypothetical protein
MVKVFAAFAITVALVVAGCAGMHSQEQPITKETKVRCPKCGYPFSVEEGVRRMETTR